MLNKVVLGTIESVVCLNISLRYSFFLFYLHDDPKLRNKHSQQLKRFNRRIVMNINSHSKFTFRVKYKN